MCHCWSDTYSVSEKPILISQSGMGRMYGVITSAMMRSGRPFEKSWSPLQRVTGESGSCCILLQKESRCSASLPRATQVRS